MIMDWKKMWWFGLADPCGKCGKTPHKQTSVDGKPAIICSRCKNTGKTGVNIGVAICEWNKEQRASKAEKLKAESDTTTELIWKASGF